MPLSNVDIQEAILKFMREDEWESITDTNIITDDASISQRENLSPLFTSEKLDKLYEIVNAINNLKINNYRYELNTATASDAQVDLTSSPDTVTHTIHVILDKNYLFAGTSDKSLSYFLRKTWQLDCCHQH